MSRCKQPTPAELRDNLLEFIRGKFYPGEGVEFAKDRRRILEWVVLWPATWLDERGVSLPTRRYQDLLTSILMEAVRHGNTGGIKYRPAWLGKVVQSHFAVHGDELYQEAKSMRSLVENALLIAGQAQRQVRPDPIAELAQAARLVRTPKKRPAPPQRGGQLSLF